MMNMNKPFIGIPCEAVDDSAWWPVAYGHRQTYIDAIIDAGGIPLLIPPLHYEDVLQAYYARIAGLLLAGGKDMSPVYYHEEPHEKLEKVDPTQDYVEVYLTRRALVDKKPILAICRGMQVLNVVMGGTLYQDIPAQLDTPIDHEASEKHAIALRSKEWTFCGHELLLEATSRLFTLLGVNRLHVNSLHHQGVRQLASGLELVGWSSDGFIEAVEGDDPDHFVVAVQCHPESLYAAADTRWQAVFAGLVQACL